MNTVNEKVGTLGSSQDLQPKRSVWIRNSLFIIGLIYLIIVLNLNISEKPIGVDRAPGSNGYYEVTSMLGLKKSINFFREGQCLGGGDWKCPGSFYKEPIPGADPATFRVLNSFYAVDKSNAYFVWSNLVGKSNAVRKIFGADLPTFKTLNDSFAEDKNYDYFAKDKNFVYISDQKIIGASPEDFKIIWKKHDWSRVIYLAVSDGKVFLIGNFKMGRDQSLYHILEGFNPDENQTNKIDAATFEVLPRSENYKKIDPLYVKDAQHVYVFDTYRCQLSRDDACKYLKVVNGANPATFEIQN